MGRLRKCFCEVPEQELIHCCREKFSRGKSTLELMDNCHSVSQQEIVSAAALLGLEESTFKSLLADEPENLGHVLLCRKLFLKKLAKLGIAVCPDQKRSFIQAKRG
jgi:hypothetical protein